MRSPARPFWEAQEAVSVVHSHHRFDVVQNEDGDGRISATIAAFGRLIWVWVTLGERS
jgi:hypothetical protein